MFAEVIKTTWFWLVVYKCFFFAGVFEKQRNAVAAVTSIWLAVYRVSPWNILAEINGFCSMLKLTVIFSLNRNAKQICTSFTTIQITHITVAYIIRWNVNYAMQKCKVRCHLPWKIAISHMCELSYVPKIYEFFIYIFSCRRRQSRVGRRELNSLELNGNAWRMFHAQKNI